MAIAASVQSTCWQIWLSTYDCQDIFVGFELKKIYLFYSKKKKTKINVSRVRCRFVLVQYNDDDDDCYEFFSFVCYFFFFGKNYKRITNTKMKQRKQTNKKKTFEKMGRQTRTRKMFGGFQITLGFFKFR